MSVTTKVTYTGDGTTDIFSVPFEYLSQSHTHVYIDDVETAEFTWNATYAIKMNSVPALGTKITIQRITPAEQTVITWEDGSILFSDDMNTHDIQFLYIIQESGFISDNALSVASEAKTIAQETYAFCTAWETRMSTAITNANDAATAAQLQAKILSYATISVGTVTSGSAPAVIKRGTNLQPIFDFVLEKGEKGDTGPQGMQGVRGVKGDKGEQGISGVAVQTTGTYAFNVNTEGHLEVTYSGDDPNFSLGTDGHLYITL